MTPSLKRFAFSAMGSACEIQLYDSSRINARHLARRLLEEVERLEQKYSRFRADSILSTINQSAGSKAGIDIDHETRSLLEHANSCFKESNGLFDITAGALSRAWDFRSARIPDQDHIGNLLESTGFNRLQWDDSRLLIPAGMELDFGGVVKEYAADSVAAMARELGVEHGLVNLGGDYSVIGPQVDNLPWNIVITDPNQPDSIMAKINLEAGGLASSGDYERFFEYEGVRYSHIINPQTGWPCNGLRAVSVAASLCTVAGSVSTIAMLKTEAEAISWLEDSSLPFVCMKNNGAVAGPGAAR